MFEKEAEEYYYKTYPVTLNIGEEERKEEVTDIFIKGAEFGYNKANEWHKVLDGDYPKHNNEVLCLLWGGIKEIGYYRNGLWYFEAFTTGKDDVDYWQEIKLPKENG